MKNNVLWTRLLMVALVGGILTSCRLDDVNPDKPTPPEKPNVEIDWSTFSTSNLNVIVADEYNSQYYYTIEVFVENPVLDPNAKMLSGSGQKTNAKVGYNREIAIPKGVDRLFIRETDPFGNKRVYSVEVQPGTMTLNLMDALRADDMSTTPQIPEIDFDYTKYDCVVLRSTTDDITLENGKNYYIPAGETITGKIFFYGAGTNKLFVEGTLYLTPNAKGKYGPETELTNGNQLYVLDGGKVLNASDSNCLHFNTTSYVAVQEGGVLGNEELSESFYIYITNSTQFVNNGTVNAKTVRMTSQSKLYNNEKCEFNIDLFETENANNQIINAGSMTIREVSLRNATFINYCNLIVTETFNAPDHAKLHLIDGKGYVYAKHFESQNFNMYMGILTLFEGESALLQHGSTITGPATTGAVSLLKIDDIKINGYKAVNYKQNLIVKFNSHTAHPDEYNPVYVLDGAASFAEGELGYTIEDSDCGKILKKKEDGGGDDDPEYEEGETISYMYMFEDEWPSIGDYDMNDLVMEVQLSNFMYKEKTSKTRVKYTVYAAGGTYQVGAGVILDGIPYASVKGSFTDCGDDAVIALFESAHAELNAPAGTPTNVTTIDKTPNTKEIFIEFNEPIDGSVQHGNFNLFALIDGDFSAKDWKEVHMPGNKGTSKAMTDEGCTVDYKQVDSGWTWGLCVPKVHFATYPKERVSIVSAYDDFKAWVERSEVPSWYRKPISGKVIEWPNQNN